MPASGCTFLCLAVADKAFSECISGHFISVWIKDVNIEKSADGMGFFDMGRGIFDTFAVFTVDCKD